MTENTSAGAGGKARFDTFDDWEMPMVRQQVAAPTDGSRTLYVLENGRPHPVNVKIGSTDGELTEITSGLDEGAQVITASQLRS